MKTHCKSLISLIEKYTSFEAKEGVEVGVWRGQTSEELLKRFPSLQLIMVDRWQAYGETEGGNRLRGKTQQQMEDAMMEALHRTNFAVDRRLVVVGDSFDAALFLGCNTLDFVWIDGDHSESAVYSDLSMWSQVLRPCCLLCGHDYDGVGDRRGRFGVKKAVDAFASEKGAEVGVMPGHVWYIIKEW